MQAEPIAAPVSRTSSELMLSMVGERKKVLEIGCASGHFASLLSKQQCDVVGIEKNPRLAEEARRFCTEVIVADLDEAALADVAPDAQFDVVVLGDILTRLKEPVRVLDEARVLLAEGGFLVASIPNVSHGAIRLALLSGRFDYQELGILGEAHIRFFTPKTADELLVSAGYRVESIERVLLPIFDASDLVPQVSADEFDPNVVAEVRDDPDSETLQLVLKALPLSNEQRAHALMKRFLLANTELADSRRRLQRREQELELLSESVAERDAAVEELRNRISAANDELSTARTEFRELEAAYQRLEVRHAEGRDATRATSELRAVNAALEERVESLMERLLVLQSEQSRETGRVAELRAELTDAVQARETLQAQLEKLLGEPAVDDDRYVAQFESELAAQRRLSQLEADLSNALEDVDRERGRVVALEDQLRQLENQVGALNKLLGDERQSADAAKAELSAAAAAELSAVARELEAVRAELQSEREARDAMKLEFESAAQQLQARGTDMVFRIHELEGLNASAEAQAAETQSTLSAHIGRIGELEEALDGAQARLAESSRSSALATDKALRLGTELDEERSKLIALRSDFESTLGQMRSQSGALSTRIAGLEAALERETAASQTLKADLEAERASRASVVAQSTAMTARAGELERDLRAQAAIASGLQAELDAARERHAVLQATIDDLNRSSAAVAASLEASLGQARERLAAEHAAREKESARAEHLAAELESVVRSTRSELSSAADRVAELQSHNAALDARLVELQRSESAARSLHGVAQNELDHARERITSLEARTNQADAELSRERALRSQLEAVLADQRERFSDLEAHAIQAVAETEAREQSLERAWFEVYAELEEVRAQAMLLESDIAEHRSAAEAFQQKLVEAENALRVARRTNDSISGEKAQIEESLTATHTALHDSREQVGRLSAEVAILKVRAVKAELRVPEFERQIEEGARYARHVESEIDATRKASQAELEATRKASRIEIEATRKAALAERIVMRDYADETQAKNDARARDYEAMIANLTREVDESRQQLENLGREIERVRDEHTRQVAELQTHVAAANAHGDEMQKLLIGAERRLLDQAEDTIAGMQAESAQLVLLIDTVQSSHFWKLKRWLGRLLGRNRR